MCIWVGITSLALRSVHPSVWVWLLKFSVALYLHSSLIGMMLSASFPTSFCDCSFVCFSCALLSSQAPPVICAQISWPIEHSPFDLSLEILQTHTHSGSSNILLFAFLKPGLYCANFVENLQHPSSSYQLCSLVDMWTRCYFLCGHVMGKLGTLHNPGLSSVGNSISGAWPSLISFWFSQTLMYHLILNHMTTWHVVILNSVHISV